MVYCVLIRVLKEEKFQITKNQTLFQKVVEAAKNANREDIVSQLNKFISYNKETEGRRLDQSPPWKNMNDSFAIQFWNSPPARRAEIPSGGGLASARGLAVIAGHVAARDSQEVISHVTKDKMQAEPTVGYLFGMKTFFTQV